jgi:hypothetical protein
MLQAGPIGEINKISHPVMPKNSTYSTIEEQSLEGLTSVLKNPQKGKTDKANALLESKLPFDMKVRALLEATTRPGIEPPKNIEELCPEFHLNYTNNVPDLIALMAAYVEVALIRSPFIDSARIHENKYL